MFSLEPRCSRHVVVPRSSFSARIIAAPSSSPGATEGLGEGERLPEGETGRLGDGEAGGFRDSAAAGWYSAPGRSQMKTIVASATKGIATTTAISRGLRRAR